MQEILEKIARHPASVASFQKSESILKKAIEEGIKENRAIKSKTELHANAPDEYEKQQLLLRKAAKEKVDAILADKREEINAIEKDFAKAIKEKR